MRWSDGLRRRDLKQTAARRLRTDMTDAERVLWALLRNRRLGGVKFRRQQPIGPYIADFFCRSARLVVELDGDQHGVAEQQLHDEARTRYLNDQGYSVIRFSNLDVLKHRDVVMESVEHALALGVRPLPEPPLAVRPSLKGRVER
ncbi:MAG: endonuclease domain-containing protein [Rhizomicrobium sp.]